MWFVGVGLHSARLVTTGTISAQALEERLRARAERLYFSRAIPTRVREADLDRRKLSRLRRAALQRSSVHLERHPARIMGRQQRIVSLAGYAGRPVDLAFVFFSPDHSDSTDLIVAKIHERLRPTVLLGCSAESVIGEAQDP